MQVPFLGPEKVEQFRSLLQNTKRVALVTHVNPDGDAIGTSLALAQCFRAQGITATVIAPNPFPDFLRWLEGVNDIMIFKHGPSKVKAVLADVDLVMCVDFNSIARVDELGEVLRTMTVPRVLIDHHLKPADDEFALCFSKVDACSSAEVFFHLAKALGWLQYFTPEVAEAVYTGLMTDTNGFQNNCSNASTFRTIAELLELGVDKNKVFDSVYCNYTESRLRLLGYTLNQKMVVLPEYHAAYIALSREELNSFHFQAGDTEGFVNYPLSIKGIQFSAFMSESAEHIRLSFRSRGNFSVNDFARNHFDGGGHLNASGGTAKLTLEETIEKFLNTLERYKNELSSL